MNDFKRLIEETLKQKRPNLSTGSLKTYVSILFNISKKIDPENTELSFFENTESIMELLKEKIPSSRKTSLSPLYVLTGLEIYKDQMVKDCDVANEIARQQVKTQNQTDNWITMEEVKKIHDHYYNLTTQIFANKLLLNHNVLVNYILLSCLGGVYIPPRRSDRKSVV